MEPPRTAPAWLTARPIAHRGLHRDADGIIENTLAAAAAAIEAGFAIECDVQLTADGEVVIFHDSTLDRLTTGAGRVDRTSWARLAEFGFRASPDRIPSLDALLALVAGRVPLICEIKSRFDADMRLADRAAEVSARYEGPLAFKSFDPAVIAYLRQGGGPLANEPRPLGIVAQANYDGAEWPGLSPPRRSALAHFLHYRETRPDFLSYCVDDLPHGVPFLLRNAVGLPVMTWTVRTPAQRRTAAEHADQIVFEGFIP